MAKMPWITDNYDDAKFIVTACNSHDALLSAAKAALLDLECWKVAHPEGADQETIDQLRAAIAQVEGGEG